MQSNYSIEISSKIKWSICYLRNNKADGEKNVRCFPECGDGGHCTSGFCGSSIKATLRRNTADSRLISDTIIVVGEFMPSGSEPTVLKESNITESLLNQAATFSKYYRATMSYPASDDSYAYLEFNANPKSWGYSYVAHRFKKNSKHQFVISILSANKGTWKGERTFTCVGIFRSTEFQIQCKRRAQCDSDQNIRFFSKDAKLLQDMSDGISVITDNTSPRSHDTNTETISTCAYGNMITPSVSESPTNILQFGEINYTEFHSTVSTITSASVDDYLESEKSEILLKDRRSLDVIITLPQSAPETGRLLMKPDHHSKEELRCSLCAVKRRESTRQMGELGLDLGLPHYRALWPLGMCPYTFATIHSGDTWTALVQSSKEGSRNNDVYCSTARQYLTTNRIALLQQLFPFDIKPFLVADELVDSMHQYP